MKFGDRDPVIRRYVSELASLTKELAQVPGSAAETIGTTIMHRLLSIAASPEYARIAELIASHMAVGVMRANAKTWREAASRSMQGRRIYAALQHEMSGPLGVAVRQIINENARLIRSLPEALAERTAHYIAREQMAGVRASEIVQALRPKLRQLTESRIRLIARTEVGKAETAITRARSERLGLDWYEWTTSEDRRVRPSHRKLDGVLVAWDDPPSPEKLAGEPSTLGHYHAGNAPNCRCIALPLVEMAEVKWPHKVYRNGSIQYMTRWQFLQIGLPRAA
jgi:SPP1 gp7 family putative phage head morphogenesis protein